MTKNICPCCQQTIKAAPKAKTGQYTSVQLESGAYMWTSPSGKQFKASFMVDKTILAAHAKKQKQAIMYDTEGRNARLGYTFADVTNSLPGIRPATTPEVIAAAWAKYAEACHA